jgi:hypothetical protein
VPWPWELLLLGGGAMGLVVVKMRLYCDDFWVDVRLTEPLG